ncbi:unnamed protein product [Notodromas monacha]|uniref:Uncharacterized protein n=1 Tax=Notodromas monacha TaxID=399045 RepID=A0A7R9BHD1_9CRUS|nr:unnamed protein product [Notodromas monacha]CAG0915510.1 unnamed protein product [Notodromas monacha]
MERNWAVRELLPVLTATTSLYVKNFEGERRRWRLRLPKTDYLSKPSKYVNTAPTPDTYGIYDSDMIKCCSVKITIGNPSPSHQNQQGN